MSFVFKIIDDSGGSLTLTNIVKVRYISKNVFLLLYFQSYDHVGAGKSYGSSSSRYTPGGLGNTSSYLNSSYTSPNKSYSSSGYQSSTPRYGGYSAGTSASGGVRDRISKFSPSDSKTNRDMYTPLSSRAPSQTRDTYGSGGGGGSGYDRYNSRSGGGSDPYGNKSGYLSDYGGSSTRSYGSSYDKGSSRSGRSYGVQSRETSPVTHRSSKYDYAANSTASPYSSYKTASETSPAIERKFDRQASKNSEIEYAGKDYGDRYDRRRSRDMSRPTPRRKLSSGSESDDSAVEDSEPRGRYLISRGTSPMPVSESPRRDSRTKNKQSIAKTKRVKPNTRDNRREARYFRGPAAVDCGTQVNLDQGKSRRTRRDSVNYGGGDSNEIKERAAIMTDDSVELEEREPFYKQREKFMNDPQESPREQRRRARDQHEVVEDPPSERSWRQSVYGASTPSRAQQQQQEDEELLSKGRRRRHDNPPIPPEPDYDNPDDSRPNSRRGERRSQGSSARDSRKSQGSQRDVPAPDYNRSSSRESMLDDKPRRRRHGSKELLDNPHDSDVVMSPPEEMPAAPRRRRTNSRDMLDESEDQELLTQEKLCLRDSIDKVNVRESC